MKVKQAIKPLFLAAALAVMLLPNASFADEKADKEYANKSISRFPVPDINELPEDLQQALAGVQKKWGFVPNVFTALAHRPNELRAFIQYNKALLGKESGLTKTEKEMLIVAFSNYNGCTYCVVVHGAILRLEAASPYISEQIATNYKEADVTPRQRAIIDFAMKVTNDSASISEEDFEVLHGHGLSDEDIWDIAGITAFYNLSNRMMNFLKTRPDEEFYKMGRE